MFCVCCVLTLFLEVSSHNNHIWCFGLIYSKWENLLFQENILIKCEGLPVLDNYSGNFILRFDCYCPFEFVFVRDLCLFSASSYTFRRIDKAHNKNTKSNIPVT